MINPTKYRKNHELYGERLKAAKKAVCARFTTTEAIPDGEYSLTKQGGDVGWRDMLARGPESTLSIYERYQKVWDSVATPK